MSRFGGIPNSWTWTCPHCGNTWPVRNAEGGLNSVICECRKVMDPDRTGSALAMVADADGRCE